MFTLVRELLFNVQFLVFHAKYTTQLGILATFIMCIKFIQYGQEKLRNSDTKHQEKVQKDEAKVNTNV